MVLCLDVSSRVFVRRLLHMAFVLLYLGTLACQQNVQKNVSELSHIAEASSTNIPASETEDTPPSPPANTLTLEQQLLQQAQDAFRQARYTLPSHDNAYDKFKSVLLVNPENAQARSGLQAIMLKYAELVRTALAEDRIRAADRHLRTAESHFPSNLLLKDLRQSLLEKQRALALTTDSDWAHQGDSEELRLSVTDLNTKSEAIISLLSDLALRLKDTDESVLIYARSDREGRWIYKQLKDAAQGYRVRGDIRLSKSPKVKIMPPL